MPRLGTVGENFKVGPYVKLKNCHIPKAQLKCGMGLRMRRRVTDRHSLGRTEMIPE